MYPTKIYFIHQASQLSMDSQRIIIKWERRLFYCQFWLALLTFQKRKSVVILSSLTRKKWWRTIKKKCDLIQSPIRYHCTWNFRFIWLQFIRHKLLFDCPRISDNRYVQLVPNILFILWIRILRKRSMDWDFNGKNKWSKENMVWMVI